MQHILNQRTLDLHVQRRGGCKVRERVHLKEPGSVVFIQKNIKAKYLKATVSLAHPDLNLGVYFGLHADERLCCNISDLIETKESMVDSNSDPRKKVETMD